MAPHECGVDVSGTLVPLNAVAVRHDGQTREGFVLDVERLCAQLSRRQGNRVLIACASAHAVGVAIFAALHAGCRAMLPANLQPGHLAEIASRGDGVVFDGIPAPISGAIPAFAGTDRDGAPPLEPFDMDRAEIVLHTSGTTDVPVAVAKTLRVLDTEVRALERIFGAAMKQNVMATVPPYHIYGLLFRVLWPLAAGRSSVAETIAYPEEVVAHAVKTPGIGLVSSPAFLQRARPVLDLDRLAPILGPVFSSGGPLTPEIAAAYNAKLRNPVNEIYGSTETGGIAHRVVHDPEHPPSWTLLPGVEVRLDSESGALSVHSPFLGDKEWFATADIAEMREDGFHLRGRLDRIVKLQEQRISLSDIETRLKASAAIQDVRVVALNRGATGRDALGAVIVPTAAGWGDIRRRGKRNLVEALSTGLRPFVQSSAVPRRWRFVRCLPCDERGKVTIRSLLDLFEVNAGSITQPNVIDTLQREKSLTLTLALPDGLFYFRGHFDEAPLLPGVVQIDWAIRFAEAHFSLIPSPYRIEALKFFNVITTGRELSLTLTYDAAILRLQFEYDVAGQKCSSGRVVLEGSS